MPSFASALCVELVDLELGPATEEERRRAAGWLESRLTGAPELTRWGIAATGAALGLAVRARHGRAYADLPKERRVRIAQRLLDTSAPVVAEFVRAVRSLTVTYVFDLRHATAP